MSATAKLTMIRTTPRKARLVVNMIRGKNVTEAESLLKFTPNRVAKPVLKLLKSAKANAVNNHDMFEDSLFIAKVMVNAGPTLKRALPRAKGRSDVLLKRTSHIEITLEERNNG
jgi:large subunit ribosomal protein L22